MLCADLTSVVLLFYHSFLYHFITFFFSNSLFAFLMYYSYLHCLAFPLGIIVYIVSILVHVVDIVYQLLVS
jgi:hypothetical protein